MEFTPSAFQWRKLSNIFQRGARWDGRAAYIRSEPPAIEGGDDFLALNGWKGEGSSRIVVHGGRGWRFAETGLVQTTKAYSLSAFYATPATQNPAPRE